MIEVITPGPAGIMSPESETIQLHAALLDLYMPKTGGDQITLKSLIDATSTSEALSSATKAFSLMLIGRDTNDSRLLFEACALYSSALQQSYQEVASPETSKCVIFGIGQYSRCGSPRIMMTGLSYEIESLMLMMQQHLSYLSTI